MSYLLDIALILLVIGIVALSAKRGFVLSVLSMLALIVAVVMATVLSDAVTPQVYESIVQERATQMIEAKLPEKTDTALSAERTKEVLASLPRELQEMAKSFGIDLDEIAKEIAVQNISAQSITQEIESGIVRPILQPIVKAVVFAILALVIYLVLRLVIFLINRITKLPVLRTANTFLGGLVGGVKGLLLLFTISLVLNAYASVFPASTLASAIERSYIVALFNFI